MRQLLLIVLLAAGVRTVAAGVEVVIEHDSARYARMARDISRGDWTTLDLYPIMPPLYPVLIVLVGSGALVSIVFGALTCVPLYLLGEGVWNARVGRWAALVYALLPEYVVLGGQMMTEATFIFFFVTAVACLARRPALWRWLLAGLAGGLAYLTRPEGVYVLAMIPGWAALSMIRFRAWRPLLLPALAGVLAWGATASPYLLWAKQKAGHWTLSPNPVAGHILRSALRFERAPRDQPWNPAAVGVEREIDRRMETYGTAAGGLVTLAKSWSEVLFYAGAVFLVAGLAALRRDVVDGWGATLVVLVGVGYLIPPILSLYVRMPYTNRYVVPGFAVLMPVVAVGLMSLGRRWRAATALVLLACVVGAPFNFAKPRNERRLPVKQAGEWILSTYGPDRTVISQDMRLEYYSRGRFRRVPSKWDELERASSKDDLLMLNPAPAHVAMFEPGFYERVEAGWTVVAEFPPGAPQVKIFEKR